jgi:hypothetical protein
MRPTAIGDLDVSASTRVTDAPLTMLVVDCS